MGNQAPTTQNHCGMIAGKGKGEQVRNAGDSKGMGRGKNEFSMNQGDMKGKGKGEGRKGKGKGTPSMGSKDGKGKTKGDAFVNNDDRSGKSEARQEQSSAGYVNLRDLQGTFEKNAMGKGERFESYKSFATNAPMAGSFANRMSFQTDVPDDVLGSRESFARGSFAALRSDESFAAACRRELCCRAFRTNDPATGRPQHTASDPNKLLHARRHHYKSVSSRSVDSGSTD